MDGKDTIQVEHVSNHHIYHYSYLIDLYQQIYKIGYRNQKVSIAQETNLNQVFLYEILV